MLVGMKIRTSLNVTVVRLVLKITSTKKSINVHILKLTERIYEVIIHSNQDNQAMNEVAVPSFSYFSIYLDKIE